MFHPTDIHVGRRLRELRIVRGLSQMALADAIGITFQQVQKYESGANRISASRLYDLARALEVPPAYFFEGLDSESTAQSEPAPDRTALAMMRAFAAITSPELRGALLQQVDAIARGQVNTTAEAPAE